MARIRWHGAEYTATPIRQLPDGNWIMRAHQHGPRFSPGTEIEVAQSEVVEMAAAEMPQPRETVTIAPSDVGKLEDVLAAESFAKLETDMAAERATLPSPQAIIKNSPPLAPDAPDKGVSVPPRPMMAPRPAARLSEDPMSIERVKEKLKLASGVAGEVLKNVEARADAVIARKGELDKRTDKAFSPHEMMLDQTAKGLDDVERALNLLSNDPLAGSGGSTQQ